MLLTSELVTNAVLHARTEIELGITIGDDSIVVTVHDLDSRAPSRTPTPRVKVAGASGWCRRWPRCPDMHDDPEGGKITWFRLGRTGASDVADGAAARPGGRRAAPGTDPGRGEL